jgi:hypothetical protein
LARTTDHEDMVVPRMWRGDTNRLTSLSIDGEYTSNTLSEPRGSVLRASVSILWGGVFRNLTRDSHASYLTYFQTLASTISCW